MSNRIGVWHDLVPDPEHAMKMFTRPDPYYDRVDCRRMDIQASDGLITEPGKKVASDDTLREFFRLVGC